MPHTEHFLVAYLAQISRKGDFYSKDEEENIGPFCKYGGIIYISFWLRLDVVESIKA